MTVEQLAAIVTEYLAALDALRVFEQPFNGPWPITMVTPDTRFVQATQRLRHAEEAMRTAVAP